MSYAIHLYHPDVKAAVDRGEELDDITFPEIPEAIRQEFIRILKSYGYVLESESDQCIQYIHTNKEWGIEVCVFPTQIAFSVPFWDQAEDAIFEASMAAFEIAHDVNLLVFRPAEGEWDE